METIVNVLSDFCEDIFGLFFDVMSMPLFAVLTAGFVVGVIFLLLRKEF